MDALPPSHPRLDMTAIGALGWWPPAATAVASDGSPPPVRAHAGTRAGVDARTRANSAAPTAFDALYRANYGRLRRIAQRIAGSEHAGEEAVQEAFTRAAARWETVGELDNPAAWVCRVAINVAIDQRRRGDTERRVVDRLANERVGTTGDTYGLDQNPALLAALRRLPRRQLTAVVLVYLEGCSPNEAAALMRCSPSTLRTHLERGRQSLAHDFGGSAAEHGSATEDGSATEGGSAAEDGSAADDV